MTDKGTGALEVTDQQAAAVQKGERVTIDQLRDQIAAVTYLNGAEAVHAWPSQTEIAVDYEVPRALEALGCLTICVLTLRNGFTCVGKSACADPANFNRSLGEKLARVEAERQAWAFLAFRLRDKLAAQP